MAIALYCYYMEIFQNRYVQIGLLTLGLGLLLWALFWLVLRLLGLEDFPAIIQVAVAFLGAGLLVAKFFARRLF